MKFLTAKKIKNTINISETFSTGKDLFGNYPTRPTYYLYANSLTNCSKKANVLAETKDLLSEHTMVNSRLPYFIFVLSNGELNVENNNLQRHKT